MYKELFIIYGQGAGDFEGATSFWRGRGRYFWQVADGGQFYVAQHLKKHFCALQAKISLKIFSKFFLGGGPLIFGRSPRGALIFVEKTKSLKILVTILKMAILRVSGGLSEN